jgi:hypothetical protein
LYSDGCEHPLESSASCPSGGTVDYSVSGDTGGMSVPIPITGSAERWVVIEVREENISTSSCEDLIVNLTFTGGVGVAYYLDVHCANCTGVGEEIISGETHTFTFDDVCVPGVADPAQTVRLYVQVVRSFQLGTSCGDWSIEVDGDYAGPSGTASTTCS